ncbi:MAG TPA: hypothetical protein VJ046_02710 [Candidatus Paceibacterota bacterium]|nr:hypothetical protein [Candidatus Paceibacterota bacterium]
MARKPKYRLPVAILKDVERRNLKDVPFNDRRISKKGLQKLKTVIEGVNGKLYYLKRRVISENRT